MELDRRIKEYSFVFERIMTITSNLFGTKTIKIGIYTPNDDATQQVSSTSASHRIPEMIKGHQDVIIVSILMYHEMGWELKKSDKKDGSIKNRKQKKKSEHPWRSDKIKELIKEKNESCKKFLKS